MNGNGADVAAHLAARVAELEAAQAITARELEQTWRPRLLELERVAELFLEILGVAAATVAARRQEQTDHMRAVERAQEDDHVEPDD
jgi:hypothetical protein